MSNEDRTDSSTASRACERECRRAGSDKAASAGRTLTAPGLRHAHRRTVTLPNSVASGRLMTLLQAGTDQTVGAGHHGPTGADGFLLTQGAQVEVDPQELPHQQPAAGTEEFFQFMVGQPARNSPRPQQVSTRRAVVAFHRGLFTEAV
ncbi:hypothetical protein [Streptomyces sp. MUSC 14]|uniref:hypothetical protein n=1 Tax=Streptomyces sp. MUSC 14 TaxID=1354889 RepID=UPI001160219A|nr:hypothetical protein [Streptomyces sp. MUSC 14]